MTSGSEELLNCTRVDHNSVRCGGEEYHLEELVQPTAGVFWVYLLVYLTLVMFAGALVLTAAIVYSYPCLSQG